MTEIIEASLDINSRNIPHLYKDLINKCWIKTLLVEETGSFEIFGDRQYFQRVAEVVLDDDTNNEVKKRSTVIKFVPKIPLHEFKNKDTEWLYIFVIDGRIVKIGGTRTGLEGRCGSYLCGHHTRERGKSGDMSKTNAFVYNTFEHYLNLGSIIDMYAYKIPPSFVHINYMDSIIIDELAQTFHIFEQKCIERYEEQYKNRLIFSNNCYRGKDKDEKTDNK
jgi:hypothetical protein